MAKRICSKYIHRSSPAMGKRKRRTGNGVIKGTSFHSLLHFHFLLHIWYVKMKDNISKSYENHMVKRWKRKKRKKRKNSKIKWMKSSFCGSLCSFLSSTAQNWLQNVLAKLCIVTTISGISSISRKETREEEEKAK